MELLPVRIVVTLLGITDQWTPGCYPQSHFSNIHFPIFISHLPIKKKRSNLPLCLLTYETSSSYTKHGSVLLSQSPLNWKSFPCNEPSHGDQASFHHMGSGDWTHVSRLCIICLHLLTHLEPLKKIYFRCADFSVFNE